MQVISNVVEAKDFAKNVIQSLADPSYWKGWSLLAVTASPELDWLKQGKITVLLRTHLPEGDGTLLWLEGCLVVILRETGEFEPAAFSQTLTKSLGLANPQVEIIAMGDNTEKIAALLTGYVNKRDSMNAPPLASFSFLKSMLPNIEELFREWNRNKQNQEGRTSPHIMIVDDDLMTLRLVTLALEKQYTVITAQSGAEAIAKHLQQRPDIVFLDVGMPDCDGLTVLNYIQQYDKECQIVMFSADDFLKTRLKARVGGAIGFLPKPFNLQGFQKYIAQWVRPGSRK